MLRRASSGGLHRPSSIGVVLAILIVHTTVAFHIPSNTLATRYNTRLYYSENDEIDKLRAEIDMLREEALVRIEEVSQKADDVLSHIAPPPGTETKLLTAPKSLDEVRDAMKKPNIVPDLDDRALSSEKIISPVGAIDLRDTVHASESTLEGTYWKIMLNIGREEGTWMPESWGVSGTRLLLQLQIQFRPNELQEKDDFLSGRNKAKVVHVVQNDGTFGPSMSESAKHVSFRDGGWQIGRGEGPMGTDLLRFYIELEEQVERDDVYCPRGRIYCTCGFFDTIHRGHSRKRDIQKKLDDLANEHNDVLDNLKAEGPFSLKRMKIWGDLTRVKAEISETNKQMAKIQVMEPDLSLLRLSRKRDIGLTRDGGVCCKVKKGELVGFYEYHILGRFEAASVEHGNDVLD